METIGNRWKNNTKEAHKFTARPILAALELKSFNEMSGFKTRAALAFKRTKQTNKTVHTITELKGIKTRIEEVKLVEKLNIHNVDTQTEN